MAVDPSRIHDSLGTELLRTAGPPAVDETIPPRDRSLPCPLSPNQQRIWFMEQMIAGEPVYNEAEAVRLHGELNVEVLEKAFNAIIARHENLRTTIQTIGDEPSAFVHDSWPVRLKQIDLSSLLAGAARSRSRAFADRRAAASLSSRGRSPASASPCSAWVRREHVFILMMHHIICDWASMGNLWRDLSALYRDRLPRPAVSTCLPCRSSTAIMRSGSGKCRSRGICRGPGILGGEPARRARAARTSNGSASASDHFPTGARSDASRSRRHWRKRCEIAAGRKRSAYSRLFAAALNALLYRYTGQEDILLGIPIADRDRPELQSMIGFLLHTHVLRTRFPDDLSFRELLLGCRKAVLDLYTHRSPPFDQVVSRVQPDAELQLLAALSSDVQLARSRSATLDSSAWRDLKSNRCWPKAGLRSSTSL